MIMNRRKDQTLASDRGQLLFVLLVITLPLQAQGVDVGLLVTINFAAALVFVLTHLDYLRPRDLGIDGAFFFLFCLWAAASTFYNASFGDLTMVTSISSLSLRWTSARLFIHLSRLAFFFGLYLVLRNYLYEQRHQIQFFLRLLTYTCGALFLFGTYQLIGGRLGLPLTYLNNLHGMPVFDVHYLQQLQMVRVFGTFGEPKGYGQFLLMSIPLVSAYYLSRQPGVQRAVFSANDPPRGWERWLILGMAFHFLLTMARSAWLAFLPQFLMLLLVFRQRRVVLGIVVVLLITGSIIFALTGGDPVNTWSEIFDSYTQPYDTGARSVDAYQELWPIILREPVWGYGLGGLSFATTELLGSSWASDSPDVLIDAASFDQYIVGGTGFVGAALFLLFLAPLFLNGFKAALRLGQQAGTLDLYLLTTLTLAATVGVWAFFEISMSLNELFPWIVLALLAAVTRIAVENSHEYAQEPVSRVTVIGSRPL